MNSSNPPQAAEYGGDEVSAIVLDPGYSFTRAGFAGEDTPKSFQPTWYAKYSSEGQDKLLFGDQIYRGVQPGMSIHNPIGKDGIVEDWDMAEKVWEHSFTSRILDAKPGNPLHNGLNDIPAEELPTEMEVEEQEKPLSDYPLLMSEPGWNPAKAREKTIEIAMEKWDTPAFYLARSGVLASFAAGKASALVIDIGASNISITPVHDGMILKRGVQHSPLGGDYISSQARALFKKNTPPIALTPHYLIKEKTNVEPGQPSQATYRDLGDKAPDASYRTFMEDLTLLSFKEYVVQTWPGPNKLSGPGPTGVSNEDLAKSSPGRPFEFPDGYNQVFGADRFRVVESLFDVKAAIPDPDSPVPAPTQAQTLPEIIKASLGGVDVDIRPHLLSNVVVTGSSSLLYGFTERLNHELMSLFPGPRVRVSAAGNTSERRFGSWLGGSILASLGAFHQMWISKKEYEEHGASIVEKRCK